jgi:hypothetical protein
VTQVRLQVRWTLRTRSYPVPPLSGSLALRASRRLVSGAVTDGSGADNALRCSHDSLDSRVREADDHVDRVEDRNELDRGRLFGRIARSYRLFNFKGGVVISLS